MPSISKHGWKCPHRREETGEALLKMQERAPRHWEQVIERRMGKKELDYTVAAVQRATTLAVVVLVVVLVVLAAKIARLLQGCQNRQTKNSFAALVVAIGVRLRYWGHYQITHFPWRVCCLQTSSTAAALAAVAKKISLHQSQTESVKRGHHQRDLLRACFVQPHLLRTTILLSSLFHLMALVQISLTLPLEYPRRQRGRHLLLVWTFGRQIRTIRQSRQLQLTQINR